MWNMTENQKQTNQKAALILAGIFIVLPSIVLAWQMSTFNYKLSNCERNPYLEFCQISPEPIILGVVIVGFYIASIARYRHQRTHASTSAATNPQQRKTRLSLITSLLAILFIALPFGLNLAEVSVSPYLATISATLSAGLAITALVSYARYR